MVKKKKTTKKTAVKPEKTTTKKIPPSAARKKATPAPAKKELVSMAAIHKSDTGSPEVQTTLLTDRIEKLSEHLKSNKNDLSSRRGLLGLVNKRRKLLSYLKKRDEKRYKDIIKKLGLSK